MLIKQFAQLTAAVVPTSSTPLPALLLVVGQSVWVNFDHVLTIEKVAGGSKLTTTINVLNKLVEIYVIETPEQIFRLL